MQSGCRNSMSAAATADSSPCCCREFLQKCRLQLVGRVDNQVLLHQLVYRKPFKAESVSRHAGTRTSRVRRARVDDGVTDQHRVLGSCTGQAGETEQTVRVWLARIGAVPAKGQRTIEE